MNTVNAFHLMNPEVDELPLQDKEKLKLDNLIEQDKCFADFEFIDGISIWEKGCEKICKNNFGHVLYARFQFANDFVPEQNGGTSFFHNIGGKNWHVRIHKGE